MEFAAKMNFGTNLPGLNFLGHAGMRLRLDALGGTDAWDTDESSFNGSGTLTQGPRGTPGMVHRARCDKNHVITNNLSAPQSALYLTPPKYHPNPILSILSHLQECDSTATPVSDVLFIFRLQNFICTFYIAQCSNCTNCVF